MGDNMRHLLPNDRLSNHTDRQCTMANPEDITMPNPLGNRKDLEDTFCCRARKLQGAERINSGHKRLPYILREGYRE